MWQLPIFLHLLQVILPQVLHLSISSLLPHLQVLFLMIFCFFLAEKLVIFSWIAGAINFPSRGSRGTSSFEIGASPKDILSRGCAILCLWTLSFIVIISRFLIFFTFWFIWADHEAFAPWSVFVFLGPIGLSVWLVAAADKSGNYPHRANCCPISFL